MQTCLKQTCVVLNKTTPKNLTEWEHKVIRMAKGMTAIFYWRRKDGKVMTLMGSDGMYFSGLKTLEGIQKRLRRYKIVENRKKMHPDLAGYEIVNYQGSDRDRHNVVYRKILDGNDSWDVVM